MQDGKRNTEHGTRRSPRSGPKSARSGPLSRVRRPGAAGFTLLELLVVMTIIGILAAVAIPALRDSPQRAREAALREDLFAMRSTIDQFHADKGYFPPDLQALVTEGYLRAIPIDPMTKSRDTWVVAYEEVDPVEEGEAPPEQASTPGVTDVHSGSTETALDGTLYKDW